VEEPPHVRGRALTRHTFVALFGLPRFGEAMIQMPKGHLLDQRGGLRVALFHCWVRGQSVLEMILSNAGGKSLR
jgi:hypothetical protein